MQIISKTRYEEWAKSHRVLWRWVAETGKEKRHWPGWFGNLDLGFYPRYTGKYVPSYIHREMNNNCFACSICSSLSCKTGCPIIHFRIKENYPCSWDGGYYDMWRSATTTRRKEKYATLIAELTWFNYEIYEKYHGVKLYSFDILEIAKVYGPVGFTY